MATDPALLDHERRLTALEIALTQLSARMSAREEADQQRETDAVQRERREAAAQREELIRLRAEG